MSVARVEIVDYDPAWPERFARERDAILRACGDVFVAIEHIGSTSVPGLAAKSIIDMMPGIRSLDDAAPLVPKLEALGYTYVREFELPNEFDEGLPERRYFRKGGHGPEAVHVHMVEPGGAFCESQLLFRNYLRRHADAAAEYGALKRRLADEYNATIMEQGVDSQVGYTDRKTEFVMGTLAAAREEISSKQPVVVAPYDPAWPAIYERERDAIAAVAGDAIVAIEHVGSTAVPGLDAKPIVDVAGGVRSMDDAWALVEPLRSIGYYLVPGSGRIADWISFDKYDTGRALEAMHLHLVPLGGERWRRYLDLRDYLRGRPAAVAAYAALKHELVSAYALDRFGYTEAKTGFIERLLERARGEGQAAG